MERGATFLEANAKYQGVEPKSFRSYKQASLTAASGLLELIGRDFPQLKRLPLYLTVLSALAFASSGEEAVLIKGGTKEYSSSSDTITFKDKHGNVVGQSRDRR